MNEAYERESDELYQVYLAKKKAIKEEWLKHHPMTHYGRGTIAGEEMRALNKWFAAAWGDIRKKYENMEDDPDT